jgi:hypothetical protein
MRLNNKIGLCMFFLVFVILFSQNVDALGVAPARKLIDFESNLEERVDLKIVNSGGEDMKVFIYAEGEMAEYVELSNYELDFSADEESKTISYELNLPSDLDTPGKHMANIVIREVPNSQGSGGSSLGASVAVVHQVIISKPYPGKYATVELRILDSQSTDRVDFVASVHSLGTQKIVNAKAIIDIFGPTNEKITTLETNLDSIDPGARRGLSAVWMENINQGKYFAKVTLTYDGEVAFDERIFEVGKLSIEVVDITVKDFKLGGIAKFNIVVENSWADPIEDVYVELVISEDGEEIGRFKSASEDIMALSKGELTAFWDSAGVEEGEYDAKIILYYGNEQIEKDIKAVISLNSIKFDLFGGGAVVADVGGVNKSNLIIIALIVLIIINVGWFVYFKKRKK